MKRTLHPLCAALVLIGLSACKDRSTPPAQTAPQPAPGAKVAKTPTSPKPAAVTPAAPAAPSAADEAQVERFCGRCHALPDPTGFTMKTWDAAIRFKYRLFAQHGLPAVGAPDIGVVMGYYAKRAPEMIDPPTTHRSYEHPTRRMRRVPLELTEGPAVVSDVGPMPGKKGTVVVTDMLLGTLTIHAKGATRVLPGVELTHASRTRAVDLDGDRRTDFLVGELGLFDAKDTDRGGAYWIRALADGKYARIPLMKKLGRVADVAAADVDGDRDLDVLVAEFGWQSTGALHLLVNDGKGADGQISWTPRKIDARHGAVQVEPADLDGDGDIDLAVYFAQELESVVVFTNNGKGQFEAKTVFRAPTPLWGANGLIVADIDRDGDGDIIHFNGDALDAPRVTDFQGVYLLENQGKMVFANQKLAGLPGVSDVAVADLDGDKDLDIFATASLPTRIEESMTLKPNPRIGSYRADSLILIEQTGPKVFTTSALESGSPCYSSVTAQDYDGDGDQDLVLGNFGMGWDLLGGPTKSTGSGFSALRQCRGDHELVIYRNDHKDQVNAMGGGGVPIGQETLRAVVENQRDAYDRLRKIEPDRARYHSNYGVLAAQLGANDDALTAFEKAVELAPGDTESLNNLATLYNQLQRASEALPLIEKVLKSRPNYPEAHNTRGISLMHLGRVPEAIASVEKAIKLKPRHLGIRSNLTHIYLMAGQIDRAVTLLEETKRMFPNDPTARRMLEQIQNGPPPGAGGPPGGPISMPPPSGR